ncbi:MAG: DedA family protein [Euryarchaeota archaeon]|nr:DedA family protein [Euryarchaeota archaeon]
MDILWLVDFIVNLGDHLSALISQYGLLTYALLFLIVFLETGIVVFPFLPGDSLIFAAGALAAMGAMDPLVLLVVFISAAILGDTVNYWIGWYTGPKIFRGEKVRFLKKEYLEKAKAFYEMHGGKTIFLARFMPIIRTFAPFVAGMGTMNYRRFIAYNVAGGAAWVSLFMALGYWFGNLPFVQHNFTLVLLAIIIISFVPGILGYLYERYKKKE